MHRADDARWRRVRFWLKSLSPPIGERHDEAVILMAVLGLMLVVGIVVTLWWGGIAYRLWDPLSVDDIDHGETDNVPPLVRTTVLRYVRGVAVALVGGFWAGALVTGPAVRLIMRLLAVTAGDDAQGRVTEADEVVGSIELDGTIGLYLFGGILPGLISGAIYVLIRRFLPAGRLGGVVFGLLHLVIAATRIDPLRPDNPDFDLVGPGWLSVTTFGLTCVLHGMAVVAIANRYSTSLPPAANTRAAWIRVLAPLALPAVFVVIPVVAAALILGLALTIVFSRIVPAVRVAHTRGALLTGVRPCASRPSLCCPARSSTYTTWSFGTPPPALRLWARDSDPCCHLAGGRSNRLAATTTSSAPPKPDTARELALIRPR